MKRTASHSITITFNSLKFSVRVKVERWTGELSQDGEVNTKRIGKIITER